MGHFVAAILNMLASVVSFSFPVCPIFCGVSFCRIHMSLFNAVSVASIFVYVGIIMYWCLKYVVSATPMLLVCLIQIL